MPGFVVLRADIFPIPSKFQFVGFILKATDVTQSVPRSGLIVPILIQGQGPLWMLL
jgi:hypothetical protein